MESTTEIASKSPAGSRPPVNNKRNGRSRITNGKVLIAGVDQRSQWVRRCRDIITAHLSDLGGVDNTSAAERSIVRRASTLTVELERLETKFALAGEADAGDLEIYQRCANSLRRLLEAVGLSRRPRVVPSPDEYLNQIDADGERASATAVEVSS
jgi:hypothetical protein